MRLYPNDPWGAVMGFSRGTSDNWANKVFSEQWIYLATSGGLLVWDGSAIWDPNSSGTGCPFPDRGAGAARPRTAIGYKAGGLLIHATFGEVNPSGAGPTCRRPRALPYSAPSV